MPLIQIQEVIRNAPEANDPVQWALDRPLPGELFEGDRIEMSGWLIAPKPAQIEISDAGEITQVVQFDHGRGDVAEAVQHEKAAAARGFRATLRVPEWRRYWLNVYAQVGSTKLAIAKIAVQRCWRESSTPQNPQLVSIIVMTDGAVDAVAATLASIGAQTYPHLEVLVVGKTTDGSMRDLLHQSPGTCALEGSAVRPSQCWTLGYRRTVGDELLFLKGGDVIPRDFLERALGSMADHPEWCAVFSDAMTPNDRKFGLIRRSAFELVGRFRRERDARRTLRYRLTERGWPVGDLQFSN